jgi:hypothetical protein
VKIVTWKVRTLRAKIKVSFGDAPINITGFSPVKKIWFPSLATTPFAYRPLKWDTQVPRNLASQFLVLPR